MSEVELQPVVRSVGGARVVTSDRRVLRGARSRRTIVRHAVDVASMEGLDGLSIGRLATDLGVSKSGVQTLFGSKENLQIATVECAREVFEDAVVRAARTVPRGAARVRALIEQWIEYASLPLFSGGCFWAANLAGFDSRPGPVRDALFRCQHGWRTLIAAELRHAADTGEIAQLDADLAAFQLDAVLVAANTALRIGDQEVVDKVRRVTEGFLAPSA
ncbi:TetR/AcrR family transcriptional regulator [Streptomyces sp. SID1328]|uniref:TetR/AcrR family transcriptional regulator n=1 Tax=Streptomyces sp. SID1328 TaxID=2690250 RepID=UPI0013701F70|nr:TetR/AcrR family transcriptional regulator [Streptomyces sp. SID1328]MYV41516.1 TetR/AcrR family transcriptional regulator [Streptomyces sp. SID1328]